MGVKGEVNPAVLGRCRVLAGVVDQVEEDLLDCRLVYTHGHRRVCTLERQVHTGLPRALLETATYGLEESGHGDHVKAVCGARTLEARIGKDVLHQVGQPVRFRVQRVEVLLAFLLVRNHSLGEHLGIHLERREGGAQLVRHRGYKSAPAFTQRDGAPHQRSHGKGRQRDAAQCNHECHPNR